MKVERFKKKRLYRIFLKVLIILNFLFIVNCRKISQNEIHVKGVFWDYCREKPLANFPIRIAVYKGNSGYKIIAETTSDKMGILISEN